MVAKGGTCVLLSEQAPALQHRDHGADELLEHAGHQGRGQDEAVAGFGFEQVLEGVGDGFGGADDLGAKLAGGEAAGGFPERQALGLGALQDDVERAAGAGFDLHVGEGLIGGKRERSMPMWPDICAMPASVWTRSLT